MDQKKRILLVDLNNFARYPTMPIGYFVSVLRSAGHVVSVFAPLMIGIRGVSREPRPGPLSLVATIANYLIATSPIEQLRIWRTRLAAKRRLEINAQESSVVSGFLRELQACRPDVVLVSTYLAYRGVCEKICAICEREGVPVIIGGSYFAQSDVVEGWIGMPGLTALASGELETKLPDILETLFKQHDLSAHEGIFVKDNQGRAAGTIALPNHDLDAVPFPDYSDFPWHVYPNKIVPIITGRGCGWGICTFCSDVTSTAGRTFRSRSPENVLQEIAHHHRRYGVSLFVFTDLKLNSDVDMWRAICAGMQLAAPGSKWVAAVHVGPRADEGLFKDDLRKAAESGCVRLTTGLETASRRLARLMRKGTRTDATSRFLRDAASVGISCRCTMILGYPGETADDIRLTSDFLDDHSDAIERVHINRFQIMSGTALHHALHRKPHRFKDVRILVEDHASALIEHQNSTAAGLAYRMAALRLFTVAHRANRKSLLSSASDFEGVM